MRQLVLALFVGVVALSAAEQYYTFEIDGAKVGYFVITHVGNEMRSNAVMEIGGERYENPFGIRYGDGDTIEAYRFGDGDWIAFEGFEADVYPSSALDSVIKGLADGHERTYRMLIEGTGEVKEAVITVKRDGDTITEHHADGTIGRHVVLDGDVAVEYGWGGTAKSVRVDSLKEAKAGTPFEDE